MLLHNVMTGDAALFTRCVQSVHSFVVTKTVVTVGRMVCAEDPGLMLSPVSAFNDLAYVCANEKYDLRIVHDVRTEFKMKGVKTDVFRAVLKPKEMTESESAESAKDDQKHRAYGSECDDYDTACRVALHAFVRQAVGEFDENFVSAVRGMGEKAHNALGRVTAERKKRKLEHERDTCRVLEQKLSEMAAECAKDKARFAEWCAEMRAERDQKTKQAATHAVPLEGEGAAASSR